MSRTRQRLDALERENTKHVTYAIWRQDDEGRDAYTSPTHPDLVLSRAELDALPEAHGVLRIVIERTA